MQIKDKTLEQIMGAAHPKRYDVFIYIKNNLEDFNKIDKVIEYRQFHNPTTITYGITQKHVEHINKQLNMNLEF